MKFNLNITDMNEEEFAKLFASINVPCKTEVAVESYSDSQTWNMPKTDIPDPIIADVDGLQWDARIHSSNHKINSDGRWQRRRGVSDEEFNRVKNELLGVQEPVAPCCIEDNTPHKESTILFKDKENPVVAPNTVAVTTGTVTPVAPDTVVIAPVVAPAPVAPAPVSPVAPIAPEPTPVIDSAVLYRTMFDKIREGLLIQKVCRNDIQKLLNAVNAQFGLQYTELVQVKDNIPALQFVINDLTARGL